jgi:hypothetical protein
VFADVTPPTPPPPEPPAEPLQLSAVLVAGELRSGERATYRVSVRNRSQRERRLGASTSSTWTFSTKRGGVSGLSGGGGRSPHDPPCPAGRLLRPGDVATFDVVLDLRSAPAGRGTVELRLDFEYLDGDECVKQSLSWSHPVEVAAPRTRP